MVKYFQLQCKRLLRNLPGAFFVALVLIGCLLLALQLFAQKNAGQEENQKFQIAICGETDHSFLQMGLSALSSFDSSRYALEILEMDEPEAARGLALGDISAYAVIPEGFMDAAFSGQIMPMKFYTTNGAAGIVSLVKEELSSMISTLLLSSQKGVYGMWDTMVNNGLSHKASGQMDQLTIVYVDYIFSRDRIYTLELLGIGDDLGLEEYVMCGLCVLLLLLICLPYAAQMIPGDLSLERMLCSKGKSAWTQALCVFLAYVANLFCLLLLIIVIAGLCIPETVNAIMLFSAVVPVLFFTAAFSFMLYSLSRDIIGGVLLMFFVSIIFCFVSGCMYPIYFFPVKAQQIAQWLPTSIARTQLASYITGNAPAGMLLALWGYSMAFAGIGILARTRQIQEVAQ